MFSPMAGRNAIMWHEKLSKRCLDAQAKQQNEQEQPPGGGEGSGQIVERCDNCGQGFIKGENPEICPGCGGELLW
jgi:rubrerythrin